MLGDFMRLALQSLKNRPLRSLLTALGIIIGVAAIISLITVSQGLERSVNEQFESFGANRVLITGGGIGDPSFRSEALTAKDKEKVETISEYEYVAEYLTKNVLVEFQDQKQTLNVIGWDVTVTKDLMEDYGIAVAYGRALTKQDSLSAMIGSRAATDIFENEIRERNSLTIAGRKFKVVGILESFGNPDDDNRIYVPIDTLRALTHAPQEITFLDAKVKPGRDIIAVAAKTQRVMEKIRDKEEFEVSTFEQLLGQINTILGVIQAVLVGVGAISIVVGGIGIMNSMYTSVLERTKEIGILKAIGARNGHIVSIFLLEAAIVSAIGGLIGVVIGGSIALIIGFVAQSSGFGFLDIRITPSIVAFGILFAVVVGVFAGSLPARQAAKLQPIEALRK